TVVGILFLQGLDLQASLVHIGVFRPIGIVLQFIVVPAAIVRGDDLMVPFLGIGPSLVLKFIEEDQGGEFLIGTVHFHTEGLGDVFPGLGIGPCRDIVGMGAVVEELVLQDSRLALDHIPGADPKGVFDRILGRCRYDDLARTIPVGVGLIGPYGGSFGLKVRGGPFGR